MRIDYTPKPVWSLGFGSNGVSGLAHGEVALHNETGLKFGKHEQLGEKVAKAFKRDICDHCNMCAGIVNEGMVWRRENIPCVQLTSQSIQTIPDQGSPPCRSRAHVSFNIPNDILSPTT